MADTFEAILSTTGTIANLEIEDLGFFYIEHPQTITISNFLDQDDIIHSQDLQDAIDAGYVTLVDGDGSPIMQVKDLAGTPDSGDMVSFPFPVVDSLIVRDSSNPAAVTLGATGNWLSPDTTVAWNSPSNITVNSVSSSNINLLTLSIDVTSAGAESDISVDFNNYGQITTVTQLGQAPALTSPPPVILDLRDGQTVLTTKNNMSEVGNVLVYSNIAGYVRDAANGFQHNNLVDSETWFKFLDISGTTSTIDQIDYVVWYSSGRFYVGIGDDEFDDSAPKDNVSEYNIAVEFRSNDLRNVVGEEPNGAWLSDFIGEDLTVGNYFRVEFDFVADTIRLYELDSGDPSDWWDVTTELLGLPNNYTDDWGLSGTLYPVIHYVESSVLHGVLAIRATFS